VTPAKHGKQVEIQFLGTSSGAPTNRRNVSGIALVESKGSAWYLIDCGEATQHQLLRSHLSLNSLEAIFITHLHGDHFYGLPGLLGSAGLNGRTKPLKIVAPEEAEEWIALTIKVSQLHLPYELEFIPTRSGDLGDFDQFSVAGITMSHRITSYGYVFVETRAQASLNMEKLLEAGIPKGPLWGKLQRGEDVQHENKVFTAAEFTDDSKKRRKVIICGDNDQPELLESECRDCDLLIHESTFTKDMADRAKSVGHTYAKAIASFAEGTQLPNLILTHISARYLGDEIQQEASSEYSGNLSVASDLDRFSLNSDAVMKLIESGNLEK